MSKKTHAKAEKLYRQLLDLLEELAAVYTDASTDEEEDDDDGVAMEDMIDAVVEEAGERGLDEESVERVFKAATALAEKSAEA